MNPIKYVLATIPFAMGWAAIPALFSGASAGAAVSAAASASAIGSASLLSTVATVGGLFSTILQGQSQARGYKAQAQAEKFNATSREIDRKRNLIRALALQNVRVGAGGIQGGQGSSAQAIQLADIREYELDQSTDKAGTSLRVDQLRQNASTAVTSSLLSAAADVGQSYGRYTKRGTL